MPSKRSPRDKSCSSAKPLSTLRSSFSRRTPVCTRSTVQVFSLVTMVPVYLGTMYQASESLAEEDLGHPIQLFAERLQLLGRHHQRHAHNRLALQRRHLT